ncbi:hypothetical protein PCASD_13954 [Puccinia coronata f. sp. avenae]|uniref:Uncharacterized protein n=1 Tax=Puccinia coronata f. sp. avenae TaxID=200324 RepID=A0A2N5U572_9BASI|nr:hypothetical protein PCASD_13954 [Puccinia coronata f. sp. avenae]
MDPLVSWKTPSWPNPSSIQAPPTRRFSARSDRERDAPDYARALSSDVHPYASSIISSSDSNSHYRSSRGSRGSIASSLLCPLLEFHDSSRRQSDAGLIMPMRPLPAINHSADSSLLDAAYRTQALIKQCNPTNITSSIMSSSNSTLGGNLFIPLRRRFLPNLDRSSSSSKPRVETQLLGELLLALEEYVAAFGRKVKVSPSHQFSLGGGSAAVAVAAAAAGPSTDPTITHLASCSNMTETNRGEALQALGEYEPFQSSHHTQPLNSPDQNPTLINLDDSPETELWGLSISDQPLQALHLTSPSQSQVDRRTLLSELCEELEYVTSEVIDVVPAFGEKLMQGHYGPLAVRANQTNSSRQAKSCSALDRFADYEPGGSQDTSDGGSKWWAERLLRDLLEGIVAETVVKSGSATTLLSATHSPFSSSTLMSHTEMSRLPSGNSRQKSNATSDRKVAANQLSSSIGKSKNWLRMSQSAQPSPLPTSLNNTGKYSGTANRNMGFSLIDEGEEISECKSNMTRELLAEASQDSLFEYRHASYPLFEPSGPSNSTERKLHHLGIKSEHHPDRRMTKPVDLLGESDGENAGDERSNEKTAIDDGHRQKLLDEGRRRWLAFKAAQPAAASSRPPPQTSASASSSSSRTTSAHLFSTAPLRDPLIHHHHHHHPSSHILNHQSGRQRSSSGSAIGRPHYHQPRHLYNYLSNRS